MDVTDTDDVADLFDRVRGAYGPVDLLVNNAEINVNESLWTLSDRCGQRDRREPERDVSLY